MGRTYIFLIIAILLASSVSAFTWDSYTGTSEWNAKAYDDEKQCGGGTKTKDFFFTISHQKISASLSDFGHGATTGAFKRNTLTIPGTTIDDEGGKSDIYEAKIVFSDDCKTFQGSYEWYYYSKYQTCFGTTTVKGTRVNNQGCPAETSTNTMLNEKDKEASLREILAKDPTNFWANYDMAELKKQQKNYPEYLRSLDKALENKNLNDRARQALRESAKKRLGLTTYPTKDTSLLLGSIIDQTNRFQGGWMFELKAPEVKDPRSWPIKLIDSWTGRFREAVDTMVKE
jgi:hypothetical protein